MSNIRSAVIFLMVIALSVPVRDGAAKMYQWTDDAGGVHFTDDLANVPPNHLKRVKEIDSGKDDKVRSPAASVPSEKPLPAPPVEKREPLFGGYNEYYWKTSFASIRDEISMLENRVKMKQENLNQLRRKRLLFKRHSDKNAYNELASEIDRDEAAIKALKEKLNAFDEEAANAGVPLEWRQ